MIGELSGLGGAAAWAIISTMMRAVSERVSPVLVNALRCTFSAFTLVAALLLLGKGQDLVGMPPGNVAGLVVSGILGQAMGDAFFVRSMKVIGTSRALPISSINPLITLILAVLLLGERITLLSLAGALLVLSGIYLLAFPYGPLGRMRDLLASADRGGITMALAAALCWSISTIILKQALEGVDLLAAACVRMSTAFLLMLALELFQSGGKMPPGLSRRTMGIMALAGVIGGASTFMYLTAVSLAGAAKASILVSTSPFFGLPLSLIFLRERINSRVLLGTLITVVGIWMVLGG